MESQVDDISKVLADNLKRLRAMKDWSQEKLASEAKISVSTIRMYENGRRWPEREFLIAVAKALRVSPARLVDDGYSQRKAELFIEAVRLLSSLDNNDAEATIDFIQGLPSFSKLTATARTD